ncbi:helix-turn-helix domain-containing protein [Vibrio campbellii]|uniref:helix-turn-helix domain-containing protein n=1 Tax=Vibrio campbellii TaxID=680 RepID=UPI0009B8AC23|nr:helix-turn-helix domain-containing protein [Vibrio campbellii]
MSKLRKLERGKPKQYSPEFVTKVQQLVKEGYSQTSIAEEFKMSRSTVAQMVRGEY